MELAQEEDLQVYLKEYTIKENSNTVYSPYDNIGDYTIIGTLLKFGHVIEVDDIKFDASQLDTITKTKIRACRINNDAIEQFNIEIDLARGKAVQENEISLQNISVENVAPRILKKAIENNYKHPAKLRLYDFSNIFQTTTNTHGFYRTLIDSLDWTNGLNDPELDSKISVFTVNDNTNELSNALQDAGLISMTGTLNIWDDAPIEKVLDISKATWGFSESNTVRYGILLRISESPAQFGLKFIINKSKTRCRLYDPGNNMVIFKY